MNRDDYVTAIIRATGLAGAARARLRDDLESDIDSRLEHGATLEEVMAELGPPRQAGRQLAADLPRHMRPRQRRFRWVFVLFALIPLLLVFYAFARIGLNFRPNNIYSSFGAYVTFKLGVAGRLPVYIANLLLHLAVCGCGFALFSRRWGRRALPALALGLVCLAIWVVQSPLALGVNILFLPYPYDALAARLLKGFVQPQCLLSLSVGICGLWMFFAGQPERLVGADIANYKL